MEKSYIKEQVYSYLAHIGSTEHFDQSPMGLCHTSYLFYPMRCTSPQSFLSLLSLPQEELTIK